jgi:PPOX class F420-dependent enzyme/OxyR family protein
MSPFTDKEIDYLRGQPLGRMATTGRNGAPHVAPVGFRLGPGAETIDVGGHGMSNSMKWRDLEANPKIAFVVDDLVSTDPWTPRRTRRTQRPRPPRPRRSTRCRRSRPTPSPPRRRHPRPRRRAPIWASG